MKQQAGLISDGVSLVHTLLPRCPKCRTYLVRDMDADGYELVCPSPECDFIQRVPYSALQATGGGTLESLFSKLDRLMESDLYVGIAIHLDIDEISCMLVGAIEGKAIARAFTRPPRELSDINAELFQVITDLFEDYEKIKAEQGT